MDEIDGMNVGDKGGITSLVKLIRQKKTKKQKLEDVTLNPIICIGNYYIDKKIKELMKVCNVFELKTATYSQMGNLLNDVFHNTTFCNDEYLKNIIISYIQGDLRKFTFIQTLLNKKPELLQNVQILERILQTKTHKDDTKILTKTLINQIIPFQDHLKFMNETERTIVALLFHENIIDPLFSDTNQHSKKCIYDFYSNFLENVCFADHIDRITFQNQIWIFNEMSSLIKTMHNNYLYHSTFTELNNVFYPVEVRFTKVLTKYSTEYNNQLFIYDFCQQLDMDREDVFSFLQELRIITSREKIGGDSRRIFSSFPERSEGQTNVGNSIGENKCQYETIFKETNITLLDIKRMYRYLDKNVPPEETISFDDNNE
jgi:hypothetical protein